MNRKQKLHKRHVTELELTVAGLFLIAATMAFWLWPATPIPAYYFDVQPTPVMAGNFKLPILMYHHIRVPKNAYDYYAVAPQIFTQQMQYLKNNNYQVISYTELTQIIAGQNPAPPNAVALTFDDGYSDQYTAAVPILKQYQYPAMFFIYTKAIGKRGQLSWGNLTEMLASGFEIGSHSVSHPHLPNASDQKLNTQLSVSKQLLENKLGVPITNFAYPYGEYSTRVTAATKSADYTSATAVTNQIYHNATDELFAIRRVYVGNSLESLQKILSN